MSDTIKINKIIKLKKFFETCQTEIYKGLEVEQEKINWIYYSELNIPIGCSLTTNSCILFYVPKMEFDNITKADFENENYSVKIDHNCNLNNENDTICITFNPKLKLFS